MTSVESDFDAFRDDFVLYLAHRLGVSKDAALSYLGDWLVDFTAHAHPSTLRSASTQDAASPLAVMDTGETVQR